MLESGQNWNDLLKIIRQEYEEVYEKAILPQVNSAKAQIPYLLQLGVPFPRRIKITPSFFKSNGVSESVFYVAAEAGKPWESAGRYDCDIRLTVVARVRTGRFINHVAFTGDVDAVYKQHFFVRYIEREELEDEMNTIRPEELFLEVLSDDRMWTTVEAVYQSKYGQSYIRPWENGIALGEVLREGELRGTYISRRMMRQEQDTLCQALSYIGYIRRLYRYLPENDMEMTMIKYRHGGPHDVRQIVNYFKYFWLAKRISAFMEGTVAWFDQKTLPEANMFFRKYGIPLDYAKDCMINLKRAQYFDESY